MRKKLTVALLLVFIFNKLDAKKFSFENIMEFLPENPVVLECGAWNGRDTLKMSKLWPKGTIHAIEGSPPVYLSLVDKVRDLENVKTYPFALGWDDGTVPFDVSTSFDKAQGSILPPSKSMWPWPHVKFNKGDIVDVPMLKLDTWAEENEVDHIDFMWLDMQGSDFNMLMASTRILETVKVIKLEISTGEFYEGTVLFDEGKAFLESRGFVCLDKFVFPVRRKWEHGDALFIRKDLIHPQDH